MTMIITKPTKSVGVNTAPAHSTADIVAAIGSLLTYEDMPEDVIYKITKMLHENVPFLRERLNYFSNFELKTALDGMAVPLHPGAKKYYVEKGLLKE